MTRPPKPASTGGTPPLPVTAVMPTGMTFDPSRWHSLPLGVNSDGEYASLDLTQGPHTVVTGPTGSGKSVFLRQHATAALTHGHDLIIVEPVKQGVDFASLRPWCAAFGCDGIGEARRMLNEVYAEGVRRRSLVFKHEVDSWVYLPAEVHREENIRPLTVMFDEFAAAVAPYMVPKGRPTNHLVALQANQDNADRAAIVSLVGQIAREMRHVGIFLVLAMPRPDPAVVPGEIRANVTHAVQLAVRGRVPHGEVLRLMFPAHQADEVQETMTALNDDSHGLAVMADREQVTGFRVLFEQPSKIPALLERRGVPRATPWVLR